MTNTETRDSGLPNSLLRAGSHHHAAIINERLNAQNENISGLTHPTTLAGMVNLASIYLNQGHPKDLDVQVMETRMRVLGLEHPDMPITIGGNLAFIFWNQGRWEEAEELGLQIMEARKLELGPVLKR